MTEKEKLSVVENQLGAIKERYLVQLEKRLEYLLSDIQGELDYIKSCKSKKIEYRPNASGIIQAKGTDIDSICIKISTLDSINIE